MHVEMLVEQELTGETYKRHPTHCCFADHKSQMTSPEIELLQSFFWTLAAFSVS
jgi:hypothetical protein